MSWLGFVSIMPRQAWQRRLNPLVGVAALSTLLLLGSACQSASQEGTGQGGTRPVVAAAMPASEGQSAGAGQAAPPATQPSQLAMNAGHPLSAVVEEASKRYDGTLGILVKNLRTGETATVGADQRLPAASLYKLFALYTVYSMVDQGQLSLDDTVTLSSQAAASDPYAEWPAGTSMKVSSALNAMITLSSNSAAHMLLERVGGWNRVSQEVARLGIGQGGNGRSSSARTSASDVAILLEAIASGKAVSAKASEEMLALLEAQRHNDRLPLPLPLDVQVAHKTGELDGVRNDAGIVYAPSGPYIIVVLASNAPAESAASQVIRDLSHDVYGYFEPGGLQSYMGLPPRLAADVLRTPDPANPILPLDDDWGETVAVNSEQVDLSLGVREVRLREMVVSDVVAMQKAAKAAGAPFWITSGYPAMSDPEAAMYMDSSVLGEPVTIPSGKSPLGQSPADFAISAAPEAISQEWLGTTVRLSDSSAGNSPSRKLESSDAGRWLLAHAWEYGFIEVPAESRSGTSQGYEPWMLRWVGKEMSARLHGQGYESQPGEVVTAELQRSETELTSHQAD